MAKFKVKKQLSSQSFVSSTIPTIDTMTTKQKHDSMSYNNKGILQFLGWK